MNNKKIYCMIMVLLLFLFLFISVGYGYENIHKTDKYAVIFVGRFLGSFSDFKENKFQQYYSWYSNAVQLLYTTLKEKYQYDDENIFLLFSLRDHYVLNEGFDKKWIDSDSSKKNLEIIINEFKEGGENQLDVGDSLLFCLIDHGGDNSLQDGINASNTFSLFPFNNVLEFLQYYIFKINLELYSIYDWELNDMFHNITNGKIIFLLQPCYSGGFINDLSQENRIICSSSRENELAIESWIEPFAKGLSGLADSDNDSLISILEAYEYAFYEVYNRTEIQHPLIDDNMDCVGHYIGERGYNPTYYGYDGYLASSTYL